MKLSDLEPNPESKMATYFTAQSVVGQRQCTICLAQKPEDSFSRQRAKYKNTGICKDCKRVKDREDYEKHRQSRLEQVRKHQAENPMKYRKINRLAVSKMRFGIDRDELIKTNTTCEHCGLTQEKHKTRYKVSLNIHHKDGWGRKALKLGKKPNNNPDNLVILCNPCHTIEHNTKRINREYKSSTAKKAWTTRRQLYGPSGGNRAI